MKSKRLVAGAWTLAAVTSILTLLVWGQSIEWQLSGLSAYQLFPVLGLIAFGLMWGHYIVAAFRQHFHIEREAIVEYFQFTSMVVLATILMHPGLLILQLFVDGLGLPPGSYYRLYGWLTVLGTLSLCVFIVYEFRRKFGERSWWRYVERLNDLAMFAVYYHGLRLGTHTQVGWFRYLWYFYGLSLALSIAYIYWNKHSRGRQSVTP